MTVSAQTSSQLAILDWGIGGMGLVKHLTERGFGGQILYFSDSGYTPYGRVAPRELKRRLAQWTWAAQNHGASHLVIACNAASSVLEESARMAWHQENGHGLPTTGIIAHGLATVRSECEGSVGIIGGERTIRSATYSGPLRAAGYTVYQRIAQPLSACVEAGQLGGHAVKSHLKRILKPIPMDIPILLACTHYPALRLTMETLYPQRRWLDPSHSLGEWILGQKTSVPQVSVWTTGDPQTTRLHAALGFDVTLPDVNTMPLNLNT